jgi:aldose 1-epimerase
MRQSFQTKALETLTLACGADRCDIVPELGGSIAGWSANGQAMMRAASPASISAQDPFGMAGFPLVPYSNRIGNGCFEWGGRRVALARNFPPEPHAIHGVGFVQPWAVRERSADAVILSLSHRQNAAWPWPFEATQRISLAQSLLSIEMSATNLADHAVPLAFGHHPYFPRDGALLKFGATGVWLVGDDALPSLLVRPFDKYDYSKPAPVARGDIDHCFVGWDGRAEIMWRDQPMALQIAASEQLRCAVVCIRSDLDGFCFEPVAHVNDALNRRDPNYSMPVIAPGESFTATIRFSAVSARAARPNPGEPR